MTDKEIDTILNRYSGHFPVPIMNIAKDLHLKIYLTNSFSDKKSGEIKKDDGTYSIYLNADHPYTRTRFTLAHEIAHLRLHRAYLNREKEIEDFVGQTYKIPSLTRDKRAIRDEREVEADQLAADILMPAKEFIKVWNKKDTADEVAAYFGVSTSAAETRARILSTKMADGTEKNDELAKKQ